MAAAGVVVVVVVEPVRAFHEHQQSLESFRVDGVDLHDVAFQRRIVFKSFLAKGTS